MRIGPKEKLIKAIELLERADYLLDSVISADPEDISVWNKGRLNICTDVIKQQRRKIEVMVDQLKGV